MPTQVITLTAVAVDLVTAPAVDLVRGEKYTVQAVIGPPANLSEGGLAAPTVGHLLKSFESYTIEIPAAGSVWVWGDGTVLAITEGI